MKVYKLDPYCGIGSFSFGMSEERFRAIDNPKNSFMYGFPERNRLCLDCGDLFGYFSLNRALNSVSLFPAFSIEYHGQISEVSCEIESTVRQLKRIADDLKHIPNELCYVSMMLGFVMCYEDGHVSNVLVFSREYYEEENKYLIEHFGVTKFGL